MFLMFLYGNYIIFLKLMTLKKRPNSTPKELFSFVENFKKGLWFLDFGATTAPLLGLMGIPVVNFLLGVSI
jgi:biopolymer transport protein ExbB